MLIIADFMVFMPHEVTSGQVWNIPAVISSLQLLKLRHQAPKRLISSFVEANMFQCFYYCINVTRLACPDRTLPWNIDNLSPAWRNFNFTVVLVVPLADFLFHWNGMFCFLWEILKIKSCLTTIRISSSNFPWFKQFLDTIILSLQSELFGLQNKINYGMNFFLLNLRYFNLNQARPI